MASYCELKTGSHMTTRQPNGKRRGYEVHFYHTYAPHHPWGAKPSRDSVYPLPVSRLCHVTHNEQAGQANCRHDGYYHFTPREKVGKSYKEDGRPIGESYRCILSQTPDPHTPCYRYIPDTEPVFPGYYSWWGLTVDPQHSPSWIESQYLPPYLKSPPESVYGSNAFESNLCDLLRSYGSSRGCRNIYLKMGGTLRYKREIAYVVIVCTSDDLGALNSYSPITHAPPDVFDPSGLVDDDGKVIKMSRISYFTTHFMNTYSSYETLNFAFYFSSPLADFQCPSNTVEAHPIDHPFCIRTKPMATWYHKTSGTFDTKWSCPDSEKAQQTHANVTRYAMMTHGVRYGGGAHGVRYGGGAHGVRYGGGAHGVRYGGGAHGVRYGGGAHGVHYGGGAHGVRYGGGAHGVHYGGGVGGGRTRDRGTSANSHQDICTIL